MEHVKWLQGLLIFCLFISTQIFAQTKDISNNKWIGYWERQEHNNKSMLTIKNVKNNSFEFELTAFSGANDGMIEGRAVFNNKTAVFRESESGDTCIISFKLITDKIITIEQKQGNCSTGLNVTYSGSYINKKKAIRIKERLTLKKLGVFKTFGEDSTFQKLVGKNYPLFINSTQLQFEKDDLDNLDTKVTSSAVRGLFTIMENIIMINSSKNIWAAVIDDNKVFYFTNRTDYKTKLPLTIEKWRSRFKEYQVIYK